MNESESAMTDNPRAVSLLANLVHAFRARDIELHLDQRGLAILRELAREGLVDLSNEGFVVREESATYVARCESPPVTPSGILFLERLPIDKFADRPALFRFLGWI